MTLLVVAISAGVAFGADWPMVRGNPQRTGYVDAELKPPFRLAWVRHFVGERIGSAVEPIVADGKLFIGTHSGNLYALDAKSGKPLWRFQANGPILHSPACADGRAVAASTDGLLYSLDAATGRLLWMSGATPGSISASPAVASGLVWVGYRTGVLFAAEPGRGELSVREDARAPIRQSIASADGRVFVTGEDLRVRAFDLKAGKVVWTSEPLVGQTARDYYPVIAKKGGRTVVIVRTNPVVQMSGLIGRDRHVICQAAGVDDSGWQKLAEWTKKREALGTLDLWAKEQAAIIKYLDEHKEARTFFVLDAETGKLLPLPPVLWAAGCQGVATPPVVLPDGRLLVLYRSAYGNWTHGVAPLVALGLLDLEKNRIEPLQHAHGMQPPWNTFWGTADESQNFVVAGKTVLIIHQGTLSGFDLETKKLFLIAGNRDTWGGFKNLPWARNEWHGPARGGVAVVGNRIYWQTGSRVLCIVAGEKGEPAKDEGIDGQSVAMVQGAMLAHRGVDQLRHELDPLVALLLSKSWAPLYVEPGLAGREFFFDDSGETFEAIAWAFPHLQADAKEKAKARLAAEWEKHPPFTKQAACPLNEGERREAFWVPPQVLTPFHVSKPHHPFGNVYAVWLYAERCGEWERVKAAWPTIKACFEDFAKMNWKLDPDKGDLYANRYLASLLAFARIAEKAGDPDAAKQANALAEKTTEALVAWWQRSAERAKLPTFQNIQEWDSFIGKGNALFYRIIPHRSKIGLFHGLTPEVAALVKAKVPQAVESIWRTFETLCPTWYLVGEERQVHFGENFVDPPDFALNAFKALAWLRDAPADDLAARVDIPFCRADLAHLTKLAITLEKK
jgi:outer membrane protein assembly factor BamB